MIREALQTLAAGRPLGRDGMRGVVLEIMSGEAPPLEIAGFLSALRVRGESLDDVLGAAEAMRELAVPLPDAPEGAIDTCGTGGGGVGTFNLSTLAALVAAADGVPVAKHGNRSATSRCGSADVLEGLGIDVESSPERMAASVGAVGIGFLFARSCHPAMRHVAPIRAALPIATVFNRLGPLTNPMRVRRQLVGVADPEVQETTLDALVALGAERAWVVHSRDARDEISLAGPTEVRAFEDGRRRAFTIEPGEFVERAPLDVLVGGDVTDNVRIAHEVLSGKGEGRGEAVALTAGAALCVAGTVPGLSEGVARARRVLANGRALELLERWKQYLREAGP